MSTNGNTKCVPNLEYDLLTVMQNKCEAVNAYDTYIEDAQAAGSQPCVELLQKLKKSEMDQVKEIRQHLQKVMQTA
ncbi:hypothetical protein [Oscillatoria acuminata]|uniref:Uncharacterized protein n=1 Tax=Oscillatoria acuminata PCC 6304 TaxID=56110 RepID=K9TD44_9CYAN|nr:hypothetical protein [Oscillatoria acuminata]AFY80061.1 hypothetical protein Oscil6304_0310 [Oscillatoria acuminata PCC 6304]